MQAEFGLIGGMNTDLLGFVRNCLRTRQVPLTEVSKGSGVPYDTLKKIASGATPNPGVRHVQALADYFDSPEVVVEVGACPDRHLPQPVAERVV